MRVAGVDGVHEVQLDELPALIDRVVRSYDVGDLVLGDGEASTLFLYWSAGRALAMAMTAGGDAVVASERDPGEGPDVELVIENGQVDVWPHRRTIPSDALGDLAGSWARGVLDARFVWSEDR